jgi:hypothetical protein
MGSGRGAVLRLVAGGTKTRVLLSRQLRMLLSRRIGISSRLNSKAEDMSDTRPPLDYLATCSKASLEAFELARLNRAANLRKELRDILEEWIEAEGEARRARYLLEGRRTQDMEMNVSSKDAERPRLPAPQMLLSFLPEQDESVGWLMTAGGGPLQGKDEALGLATKAVPHRATSLNRIAGCRLQGRAHPPRSSSVDSALLRPMGIASPGSILASTCGWAD